MVSGPQMQRLSPLRTSWVATSMCTVKWARSSTGKDFLHSSLSAIDAELTVSAHVTALCRSGFFQLRQLRPFVRSLTTEAAKTLVQAFISCRLDYCNSLLYRVTENVMKKVQSLQNAAARLITMFAGKDLLIKGNFWLGGVRLG